VPVRKMRQGSLWYAIQLNKLDVFKSTSDLPIRKPAPILSRLLTFCLRERPGREGRNVMVKIHEKGCRKRPLVGAKRTYHIDKRTLDEAGGRESAIIGRAA
jgi:hypothetical protein